MGGVYRRSRVHKKNKEVSRRARTCSRTKDLDQIHEDLLPGRIPEAVDEELDLPGGGRYRCVECSRCFIDDQVLTAHRSTKLHKKRLKLLREKPYTVEEAQAAGGICSNEFYQRVQSSMVL